MIARREQVTVAGSEEIGVGGDCRGDDMIVVDVGGNHTWRSKWGHKLHGIDATLR